MIFMIVCIMCLLSLEPQRRWFCVDMATSHKITLLKTSLPRQNHTCAWFKLWLVYCQLSVLECWNTTRGWKTGNKSQTSVETDMLAISFAKRDKHKTVCIPEDALASHKTLGTVSPRIIGTRLRQQPENAIGGDWAKCCD